MAILSDFFIASESAIQQTDLRDSPASKFTSAQLTGIDTLLLAGLHSLLLGKDIMASFDLLEPIISFGEDGPWVIKIPDQLCLRLQELTANDIEDFGQQWSLMEEWGTSRKRGDNARAVLATLVSLARGARNQKKGLYMWLCL